MDQNPQQPASELESDPRFPSGPWVGFFTDRRMPGKHQMELRLTFSQGTMIGEGRDPVGMFSVRGQYELSDGTCNFTKTYLARHEVFYRGFNEGKGIWGNWELTDQGITLTGGFHIWPEGMPDPTLSHLEAEADVPQQAPEPKRSRKKKEAPAGV